MAKQLVKMKIDLPLVALGLLQVDRQTFSMITFVALFHDVNNTLMRLSLQHSVNLHTLLVGNHLHSAISLFSLLFHLKNFKSPYEDEQVQAYAYSHRNRRLKYISQRYFRNLHYDCCRVKLSSSNLKLKSICLANAAY